MAEVIKIEGGHPLSGTVRISAAKNATVALIPATVLADGVVTIFGVPNITDVDALSQFNQKQQYNYLNNLLHPEKCKGVKKVSDLYCKNLF